MELQLKRILGEYSSGNKGPLLFITAGIHGNEPSGVEALQKVFTELEQSKPQINGTMVGISGNLKALKKKVRFIDEDLNRTWTIENIQKNQKHSAEIEEMFEIISVLENYPVSHFENRYFLDCHTTSSESIPYISEQDKGGNDLWAHRFPTHIIRGFSDIVSGTIDHYMTRSGLTGFVLEAGQHQSKDAMAYHEGTIWLALQKACNLSFTSLKNSPKAVEKVEKLKSDQKTFEIVYRHGLKDTDDFTMQSGYKNFQSIEKGELLAVHNGHPVKSEWNAFIFMPLYQNQGNDGFFVVQEVR